MYDDQWVYGKAGSMKLVQSTNPGTPGTDPFDKVTETVYFKPREDQPAYVNGKFVSHAQNPGTPGTDPFDKVTETVYFKPREDQPAYVNGKFVSHVQK